MRIGLNPAGPSRSFTPGGAPVGGANLTQATWYIDPANGSDSNDGTASDSAHALKTLAELHARWGFGGRLAQNTSVFVLNSPPLTDTANPRISGGGASVLTYYAGSTTVYANAATSEQTGTFTALTALVRSTNTPWNVTDTNGAASWPTTYLGHRIRVTGGANSGMFAWIAKSLAATQARISAPETLNATVTTVPPTIGAFTNGDAYAIESQQVKLTLGDIFMTHDSGVATAATGIVFQDFELNAESGNASIFAQAAIIFRGCKFKFSPQCANLGGTSQGGVAFSNCCFDAVTPTQLGGFARWEGGLIRNTAANTGLILRQGWSLLGSDLLVQGGGGIVVGGAHVHMAGSAVGGVGIFDAIASGTINTSGAGLQIGVWNGLQGGIVTVHPGGSPTSPLYGSGNAGAGVNLTPGHRLIYQTGFAPCITGSTPGTNDFAASADAANMRAFDDTTGAATTIRAASWANLVATIAGGGFAGNAHDFQKDAHVMVHTA